MGIVGPGSLSQDDITPDPLLNKASEYEFVTILNPLTDDFAVRVAQDIPADMPFEIRKDGKTSIISNNESDVARNYGFDLKNPDFTSKKRLFNDIIIKSGQTINLKGNEAQVAVRQIVNEIMQREGNGRFVADPVKRREVEERIVQRRGSVQELLDNSLTPVSQQINQAIEQSNKEEDELTKLNQGSEQSEQNSSIGPKKTRTPKIGNVTTTD